MRVLHRWCDSCACVFPTRMRDGSPRPRGLLTAKERRAFSSIRRLFLIVVVVVVVVVACYFVLFLFIFIFSVFLHNIRFCSFCSHRAACVRKSDCLRVVVIYVFRHHKVHCTHNRSSFNAAHHRQSFDVVTRLRILPAAAARLLACFTFFFLYFYIYSSSVFFIRFLLFSLYLSHQNTRRKHEKCTLTEIHTEREHCTGVCVYFINKCAVFALNK